MGVLEIGRYGRAVVEDFREGARLLDKTFTGFWRELADKVPLRRLGEPDEVAALAAFLASPEAGYITGQVVHINGGLI